MPAPTVITRMEVWIDTGINPDDHDDSTLDQIWNDTDALDEDVINGHWHLKVPAQSPDEALQRVKEALDAAAL